ncbi:mitochondrial carrier homolog 2-like [Cylas formicarius]|uniref:mitochondrial carrier homolog 2-like n=1 Tax=Cylas formicarius TaxID=197179 RepID=UPI0029587AFA|nr:mitochondrial carrier homolog 2-like [Cylas formicarius]
MSKVQEIAEMSKKQENKWSNFAFRIIVNSASHPFEYAKVLIQIGYEPIPPRPAKTFFGKPALKLPNIFQYVKHIKSVDGFVGLYTGLAPKLCGNLLSTIAAHKCAEFLNLGDEEEELEEETEEQSKKKWIKSMKSDLITHSLTVIVSQPFHVITVRMMAQFVGKETKYCGLFTSIREIYHDNGILGFFSGLVPRMLGDVLALILAGSLTYTINRYFIEERELKVYTGATMNFLSSAIMYPFQVVSNCMAVTNSGLAIGSPAYMPHYNSWVQCWLDLSKKNQLKRGSSLLVRYYVGPSITIGGKPLPITKESNFIS